MLAAPGSRTHHLIENGEEPVDFFSGASTIPSSGQALKVDATGGAADGLIHIADEDCDCGWFAGFVSAVEEEIFVNGASAGGDRRACGVGAE